MAKDADGNFIPQYISQNAYANPDQKSGYWDDNSKVTIWNPETGQYNTVEVDPQNVSEFAPQNDKTGYYINEQGDYVLGYEDGAALGFNGEVYEQNYDYGGPFIPTEKLTPIPPGGGNNGGGTNPGTPVNPTVPTPGTPLTPLLTQPTPTTLMMGRATLTTRLMIGLGLTLWVMRVCHSPMVMARLPMNSLQPILAGTGMRFETKRPVTGSGVVTI